MIMRQIKKLITIATGGLAAMRGFVQYCRHGEVTEQLWMQLLEAHCATNGGSSQRLDNILRATFPPRPTKARHGLLGDFSPEDQRRIANTIARDGYYIFPNRLPEEICHAIEQFASCIPAMIDGEMEARPDMLVYDRANPRGRLYKFREEDTCRCDAIQTLIADQALLGIAEAYLNTATVVGGIDLWWSAPYGNGPSSKAAQLFHFDFDAPPRWLKMFVYLTDVESKNGPHIFVKGTHHNGLSLARDIRRRGYVRISDDEILSAFGEDSTKEIVGPRGTVFFADTRAFHKGKHPEIGDRLLAQIFYCSPVFNKHAPRPRLLDNVPAPLSAAVAAYPAAYVRYLGKTGAGGL